MLGKLGSASLRPPRLIEIAGPAGAGKTTLLRRITSKPGFLAPGSPTWAPSLVALATAHAGRWNGLGRSSGDRAVVRCLAHLEHWARLARRETGHTSLVIDQGPVFRIIQVIDLLGLPGPGSGPASWWSRQLSFWSGVLDTVVYLDSADEVLLRRISGRPKHHRLQDRSQDEASGELSRVRASFAAALLVLEGSGVEILRVDTGSLDPEMLERLIAAGLNIGR
ncbi:MAG: hypothetical protein ACRDVL_01195 [Acidimicrobiia bacterium]